MFIIGLLSTVPQCEHLNKQLKKKEGVEEGRGTDRKRGGEKTTRKQDYLANPSKTVVRTPGNS